jgi:hypothetical protein
MELIDLALDVTQRAGPFGLAVLFIWLLMSGKIVTAREMKREQEVATNEIKRLEKERDLEREEKHEWKFMAHRGTDMAEFFKERVGAPS